MLGCFVLFSLSLGFGGSLGRSILYDTYVQDASVRGFADACVGTRGGLLVYMLLILVQV